MQPTQITVPYELDETTPAGAISGTYTPDGPQYRIVYKCFFEDHFQLASDLIGQSFYMGGEIVRIPPEYLPLGKGNLFCTAIDAIEPYGLPIQLEFEDWAGPTWTSRVFTRVTALFEVPKYDPLGQNDPSGIPYTTSRGQIAGEFITLPNSVYKFADTTPCENVGFPIAQQTITLTRHKMPYLPIAEIAALQSTVNQAAFSLGDQTYPAANLLFLTMDYDPQQQPDGTWLWELTYNMVARPISWNFQMHPDGTFKNVTNSAGNPPFTNGDFTQLV